MVKETTVESAMSIIMHAGDARVACKKALNAIEEADFETAEVHIKEASKEIAEAHKIQTDAVQGEIRGEEAEYSLLFAHAQDTLMTIYSEINMTKQMMKIFKAYEKRIAALEQK